MSTSLHTADDVIRIVTGFSDDHPNTRYYESHETGEYGAGNYFAYGAPSCIFGQALYLILDSDEIMALQTKQLRNKKVSAVLRSLEFEATPEELRWLDLVQRKHDQNYTYREAVAFANTVVFGLVDV